MTYDEFDWFDHDYVERFLCEQTSVVYSEQMQWDAVGVAVWDEFKKFKFACRLTFFANDKIRLLHFIPLRPGEASATFENTNPQIAKEHGGKVALEDWEKTIATFNSTSNFLQQIDCFYSEEMHGIRSYSWGFHRGDGMDHDKYNGFNFTSTKVWDATEPESFWYNRNTTALFST